MKKQDILLVIACKEESSDLLEALGVDILYTGVGKINASYFLSRKLYQMYNLGKVPKYIINVGSCGSKHFKRHQLVVCNEFKQLDMDCTAFGYKLGQTPQEPDSLVMKHKLLFPDIPRAICGTQDKFETKEPHSDIDVIDMEAYALAKICNIEHIDFNSIKYVTDNCSSSGEDDWNKTVPRCAQVFYEYLKKHIEEI